MNAFLKKLDVNEANLSHLKSWSLTHSRRKKEEWKKQEKDDKGEKTKGKDEGRGPPGDLVNGKEPEMSLSSQPGHQRVAAAATLD